MKYIYETTSLLFSLSLNLKYSQHYVFLTLFFFSSNFFSIPGEIQISAYPGRIIVTEPKGMVQPRINVEKHSLRHVVLNGQTTLPCIAQGHPVPTYR